MSYVYLFYYRPCCSPYHSSHDEYVSSKTLEGLYKLLEEEIGGMAFFVDLVTAKERLEEARKYKKNGVTIFNIHYTPQARTDVFEIEID